MSGKTKLELTWIGKEHRPRLEPRILQEDKEISYRKSSLNMDNVLIKDDNLLALKALEYNFLGKVKCVFIDPPYNTGSAFAHYDDATEHSQWLSLMRDRLELLGRLLADDGSIWVCIDDNEGHYLKVLMDELFGRNNFLASVIWNHSVQAKGYGGKFSVHHNYILAYRRTDKFVLNDLPREVEHNVNYSNPDNDAKGPWRSGDVRNSLVRPNLMYDIITPGGSTIKHPAKGWRFSRETFDKELLEGKIKFSGDESRIIRKIYLADQEGRVPETVWFAKDSGTTRDANGEVRSFVESDYFDTPKPERLLQKVLTLATNPGDLVLDSFAGSGTTGAVAHKMGRWIMVELGEHCHTHIIPRMKKVIDGQDPGGITDAVGWKGGGGFRYYRLAPSLLMKDKWDQWVISPEYNAVMLAEAMCKHENFTYDPSPTVFWQQGRSTERDFIYTTTHNLNREQLVDLNDAVGPDRSLLICCKAFRGRIDDLPHLTVKKIPTAIRERCEFGRDDYSLQIPHPPAAPALADNPPPADAAPAAPARKGRGTKAAPAGPTLFDAKEAEN